MVVFTCNTCGDSLQKPKVEKHYQTVCKSAKNLTCVDCFKDFREEEYIVHTKCLTEDERYAAKGSLPNGVIKKGEVKQQTWTDLVRSVIDREKNLTTPLRNMLNIIGGYANIPRKKVKFINFVRNSFGRNYNHKDIEIIWDLIEKHKAAQFPPKQTGTNGESPQINGNTTTEPAANGKPTKRKGENNENKNKVVEAEEIPKKKKKAKTNCENTDTSNQQQENVTSENGKSRNSEIGVHDDAAQTEEAGKFSYEDTILEVLKEKKQLSLKKLQKKVLNAYAKHNAVGEHSEKQVKKFNKRLKKMSSVEIKNDLVVLT